MSLRSGYTTGVYATASFCAALNLFLNKEQHYCYAITLPKSGDEVRICVDEVCQKERLFYALSTKGDNDDIDATKGCQITVSLGSELVHELLSSVAHEPHVIKVGSNTLYLYAGKGMGVATKKGLKVAPNFAAINPAPLGMIEKEAKKMLANSHNENIHAIFSVLEGESIARNTANAKVGVLGGISILGTTGIVKPISAGAYLDSIESEISVAHTTGYDKIIMTLGNSAFDYAKEHYEHSNIVEVGNFIYDSLKVISRFSFSELIFITSIGKMTKVAQAFKNTHNRYGTIDFEALCKESQKALNITLKEQSFATVKGLSDTLYEEDEALKHAFFDFINKEANKVLCEWGEEVGVVSKSMETIIVDKMRNYKVKTSC